MKNDNFMTDEDIKKLKNCRAAIDKHRNRKIENEPDEERTASTNAYMKVLNDNGFGNVSEFKFFNAQMNKDEKKRCNPLTVNCDGCPDLQIAPCVKAFGGAIACASIRPKVTSEAINRYATRVHKEKSGVTINGRTTVMCPRVSEGIGIYTEESERIKENFDTDWIV